MYLKRLEIHGFKSFASRTALEFGPGVTVVVGPNGSGKTNVAEAIRWVLGEQASRIIRARKTEDVIFSGSTQRAQLGMAEVNLTLENSDGWLPLDFSEVVVTRRAYRSGDNEYYINRSPVRLRDVTELFLKAQVGQNSYAFMGQGLVEAVLTLRPEERRGLIEEAADVRLHRAKLDEARNRLAATRDNLKQVALLVGEIEPRLRQLERQAERAAKHGRLSAELRDTLQVLFGHQWQEGEEALTAARAGCDQRQEECERARREAQACDEGLAALTSAIDERRREIAAREHDYRRLQEEQRELRSRVDLDEQRLSMLRARREELAAELPELHGEQERLASARVEQSERRRALEESLPAARDELAAAQQELDGFDERLRALRARLAEAEQNASPTTSALAEIEGRLRSARLERDRIEGELAALEGTRGELKERLRAWSDRYAELERETAGLRAEAERLEREQDEAQARFDEASRTVRRLEEETRLLAVQIESAQARLQLVEAMPSELPAPDAGVRAVLAAGGHVSGQEPDDDHRIEGVVGLLGQLLRVPAGLERAIEAALADSVHAVVVQSHEDALAAAELLISEDLGRAAIYPLDAIQPVHPLNLLEERGLIGVASELVKCEGRYRQLVDALLGRTIIVENLGVAQRVRRRGLGTIVTLDGILMRPLGSLAAGSAKPIRQSFVRQREETELPGELERLQAKQQETASALDEQRLVLQEATAAVEQLRTKLDRIRPEAAATDEGARRQRRLLQPLSAQLAALDGRRDELAFALPDARAQVERLEREVEQRRADAAAVAGDVEAARRSLEASETGRNELAARASDCAGRLAGQEAELRSLGQLLDAHQTSQGRIEEELTQKTQLAAQLEGETEALARRLDDERQAFDEKERLTATAGEELEPARRELAQLESRQRSLGEELGAARARALEAERALLDAEADVRRRSEEIDILRQRIEEEGFGMSPEGFVFPLRSERPPAWLSVEGERTGDDGGQADADQPAQREQPVADGDLPPMRGGAEVDAVALKERAAQLRAQLRSLGPVNEQAETDYAESRERYDYLTSQTRDLQEAEASLREAIQELERIIKGRFTTTFQQVNEQFGRYFEQFFGGGQAELVLTEPEERTNGDGRKERLQGIDIIAQPPRKRVRSLNMLSGGERSLTALALLFALLQTHPSPICVLDEVDAALDDANVDRFTTALRDLAERTQFIIITHNRRTIEMADTIYGVSMGEDSTTSVLSLRLSDIPAA